LESSVGVFGEDVLLWLCLLTQSPQRPDAQTLWQHAAHLLDELKRSPEAQALPVQSVDDGMFAIAALIDEIAMAAPDLGSYWRQYSLLATRFNTTSGGVEVFQRLDRVRVGPPTVIATYAAVLGLGFMGCYGLPHADRYALSQLRRDLGVQLGVDPDRDWSGGVLKKVRADDVEHLQLFSQAWYKSVWVGRTLAVLVTIGALGALLGLLL